MSSGGLRAAKDVNASKQHKVAETPLAQTLKLLMNETEAHPRRLTALHTLNGMFLDCDTHEKCLQLAHSVPDKAVICSLSIVASGQPHAHLALDFLHFVCFREDKREFLHQQDAVPLLVGLLKGGGEFELNRSALSLLVSLSQDDRGADQLGRGGAVAAMTAKNLLHPQSDYRDLWLRILRALLLTPAGRRQVVYKQGILQDLAAAAATVEGMPAEAPFRKQLLSVAAEVRLYMTREQNPAGQQRGKDAVVVAADHDGEPRRSRSTTVAE